MNSLEIARTRLGSQQISDPHFNTVKDLVGWMGAMQAQDYHMAQWALGLRLPGFKLTDIKAAIDRGEIIRTHLMRPTWHFVSSEDIYWMLDLTASLVKAATSSREKALGLSEAVFSKSNEVIQKALAGGNSLTRAELVSVLQGYQFATQDNRASHLFARAELDGLICSGAIKNGKPTYALLEERVQRPKPLGREAALARLAKIYFSSHGPATLDDFFWWSGLTLREARQALEMVKHAFVSELSDSQTYWFLENASTPEPHMAKAYLVPAFDEFIISYKDRRALDTSRFLRKAISENGFFRPTIVVDGQVKGVWKRSIKKDRVILDFDLFELPDQAMPELLEEASQPLGYFLDKQPEINLNLKSFS